MNLELVPKTPVDKDAQWKAAQQRAGMNVPATEKGFHDSTQELADGAETREVDLADFEAAQAEVAKAEVIDQPAQAGSVEYTPEQIVGIRKEAVAVINMIKPLESQVRAETALQAQLEEQQKQLEVEVQGEMTEELLHRLAQLKGSRESNATNLKSLNQRLDTFKKGFD